MEKRHHREALALGMARRKSTILFVKPDPWMIEKAIDPIDSEFQLQYVTISLENLLMHKGGGLHASPAIPVSDNIIFWLGAALKRARDRISGGASVRLLRCIQKVMEAGRPQRMQAGMQNMVLLHANRLADDKEALVLPSGMETPRTAVHALDRMKHTERMRQESATVHHVHPLQLTPPQKPAASGEALETPKRPTSAKDKRRGVKQQDACQRCMTPPYVKRSNTPASRRRAAVACAISASTSVVSTMAGTTRMMGHQVDVIPIKSDVDEAPMDEEDVATWTFLKQLQYRATAKPVPHQHQGTKPAKPQFLEFMEGMTPPPKLSGATSGFFERCPKAARRPNSSPASLEFQLSKKSAKDRKEDDLVGSPSNYNRLCFTLNSGKQRSHSAKRGRRSQRTATAPADNRESLTNSLGSSTGGSKQQSGKPSNDLISALGGVFTLRPRSSGEISKSRNSQTRREKDLVAGATKQLYEQNVDRLAEHFLQQRGFEQKSSRAKFTAQDREYKALLSSVRQGAFPTKSLPKTQCIPLTWPAVDPGQDVTDIVDRCSTIQVGYMRSCVKEAVNPRLIKFLAQPSEKLDLDSLMLQDRDLQVLIDGLQAPVVARLNGIEHGVDDKDAQPLATRPQITEVKLGNNRGLSDEMLSYFLSSTLRGTRFTEGACIGPLRTLSFANCPLLGKKTLQTLCELLHRGHEVRELQELDLSGVAIPPLLWPQVTESIKLSRSLRRLRLAQTECGRHSQTNCTQVADLIGTGGCRRLEFIDISGNHFLHQGCMAVGAALRNASDTLQELDLSHNAGFASDPAKELEGVEVAAKHHTFNPIMHVLEVLGETTVTRVSFVNCQLSYEEDCILEDVVESSDITHLDVSDNPHGEQGLRCLVRLLVRERDSDAQLEFLTLSAIRNSPLPPETLKYDFVDPSASYRLVLKNPQHRSILRLLCKRSEESKGWECFQDEHWDGKPVIMKDLCWKRLDRGGDDWQVPEEGVLKFSFKMPPFYNPQDDVSVVFSKFERRQKVKVNFTGFARLTRLYSCLPDERSQRLMIAAMSRDLVLKLCQVQHLAGLSKEFIHFMMVTMLPTVEERTARRVLGDLIDSCRAAGTEEMVRQVKEECRSLLYFNALHPDGHYELNLPNKVDRSTAQRCIVISNWVRTQAITKGRPDLSEHGNYECLRNTKTGMRTVVFDSHLWQLPDDGVFNFDVVLPRIPLDEKGALESFSVKEMRKCIQESQCNFRDRLLALRLSAHLLTLTPEGLVEMIEAFPLWPADLPATEAKSYGLRPRAEAYIILYNRTCYHASVVSSRLLYNQDIIEYQDCKEIQDRLGWIHTFDLVNCHTDTSNNGPRHGPMNLFTYDGWLILKLLIMIGGSEYAPNFIDCFWSERATLVERGYTFMIPASWVPNPPRLGEFTCTWWSRPEEINYMKRKEWAIEFLGWTFAPRQGPYDSN
mmetsp:Transcript_96319/g.176556  ORF Transcript_96319/g.176556 Transcript_96319/m.176556 type:complete len:1441 (-) Transcript_96319:2-4324(-)